MTTEYEFYKHCEAKGYSQRIIDSACQNSWADGARVEYDSDEHAWQAAIDTADMIADQGEASWYGD